MPPTPAGGEGDDAMAPKKKGGASALPPEIMGQLEMFANSVRDGDAADWTAVDSVALGSLVGALVAADAGLMLRAAEQRSSVAVGLFLGGPGRWVTCRDQRELLAVLQEALAVCERVCGLDVPEVAPRARTARKRA